MQGRKEANLNWYRYKGNKYNAKKTEAIDHETGEQITIDSQAEAKRYEELKILLKIGEIKDLKRQVRFLLTEEVREPDTVGARGGIHKGKLILRASSYVADFVYTDVSSGERVVEDAKGFKTKEYELKKKMMYEKYKILIKEV